MTTLDSITSSDEGFLRAVKIALKDIVRPWEVLCGFTDIGGALVPDVYAKSPEDFDRHISSYMDADTPVINKKTGDILYKPWDDDDLTDAMKKGKYIKVQNKPKYVQE